MKLLWTMVTVLIAWSGSLVTFMMVAFAGGGLASNPSVSQSAIRVIDLALFILPGFWAVAGVLILVAYFKAWGSAHYWWLLAPLPPTVVFVFWMVTMLPRS